MTSSDQEIDSQFCAIVMLGFHLTRNLWWMR